MDTPEKNVSACYLTRHTREATYGHGGYQQLLVNGPKSYQLLGRDRLFGPAGPCRGTLWYGNGRRDGSLS